MLYGIDPIIGPDLLRILRAMGHGDEIAIVDANYPAASIARQIVRIDGSSATEVLRSVIKLLPLDTYVECPVHTMQVVNDPTAVPDIVSRFQKIVNDGPAGEIACETLERMDFYQRVLSAFAIVVTGERRLYGNVLLKKGIIDDDDGSGDSDEQV